MLNSLEYFNKEKMNWVQTVIFTESADTLII